MIRILIAASLLTPFAGSALAQWMPVVADQHKAVYRLNPDGARIVVSGERGVYYRSSNGSTYSLLTKYSADGRPAGPGYAILQDRQALKVLRLSYASQTAYDLHQPLIPAPRRRSPDSIPGLRGMLVIEGILCHGLPVSFNGATVGTSWVDLKDDLELQSEFDLPGNGVTTHVLMEKTNVRIGQEPPPGPFQIPAGWTVRSPGAAAN